MKSARSAVKSKGSIVTTKNLFAIIAKPEMIAVHNINSVPMISFLEMSFSIFLFD